MPQSESVATTYHIQEYTTFSYFHIKPPIEMYVSRLPSLEGKMFHHKTNCHVLFLYTCILTSIKLCLASSIEESKENLFSDSSKIHRCPMLETAYGIGLSGKLSATLCLSVIPYFSSAFFCFKY